MRRIAVQEARDRFDDLLDAVQREPVTIERLGQAVAAVLSADDYQDFEALKLARLRGAIQVGLDDVAAGRSVEAETAFARVREQLDLFLPME